MKLWPWSKRKITPTTGGLIVRAKYDAARTTADNRKHWVNADYLSADASITADVRQTLRSRARYEVANNSYACGIGLTLANDVIGTGPRLQMLTGSVEMNRRIETEFSSWARSIGLAAKLRTMRMERFQDGEAFGMFFDNPVLASPVHLDLCLIEADQVSTPTLAFLPLNAVDGIVFDSYGNPREYHVLKQHPGDARPLASMDYDRVPASDIIHWFRADRPGQSRGVPDILPALSLFAQLRRYTLAVLGAAESAANIAVIMKTNAPAGGEAAEVEPLVEMEFAANMAIFSPEGWEPSQLKAEQPATTYDMFKREILNEIARCLNMPYNVAACNSSDYNYASGRLDHQTYYKSIRVEQTHVETVVLDRLLASWLVEAGNVLGLGKISNPAHQWFWDGPEHIDPNKEANAQETRLLNRTTTLASEYAKQGKDWEVELRQTAKEEALQKELGLGLRPKGNGNTATEDEGNQNDGNQAKE